MEVFKDGFTKYEGVERDDDGWWRCECPQCSLDFDAADAVINPFGSNQFDGLYLECPSCQCSFGLVRRQWDDPTLAESAAENAEAPTSENTPGTPPVEGQQYHDR